MRPKKPTHVLIDQVRINNDIVDAQWSLLQQRDKTVVEDPH